ncbi:MAG: EF-P lysine aminoacylase EpmA [Sulfurifustaceae bacterium]
MAPEFNDEWRPTASLETLRRRAQLLDRARDFFARRGVLEVETPILSAAGTTDPNLHSFAARSLAPADDPAPRYLHTSPEFAMKRLLAAGSGSIYQICKAFRAGERGRRHTPEFTMIEWYRVGFDQHELMDEVAALVTKLLEGTRTLGSTEKLSYREAFMRYAETDPHTATAVELRRVTENHGVRAQGVPADDADGWRDLALSHLVEPHLGRDRLTFLYDYPASAAALARVRAGDPPLAERFELYLDGMELANGFRELADAGEQLRRFERDIDRRGGTATPRTDERLLAALAHGLPDCSGVALGFDRVVMLAVRAQHISEVVAFPEPRA